MPPTFKTWLGELLKQNTYNVNKLLNDNTALHFLIAWSLFESKCFKGDFVARDIPRYALRIVEDASNDILLIRQHTQHFHVRYQDEIHRENMVPERTPKNIREKWEECLRIPFEDLSLEQAVFLGTFVASRFRNNMFHGVKGIDDWLYSRPEIILCTEILQILVSLAEAQNPTLLTQDAA